jgi:hypothetical protein
MTLRYRVEIRGGLPRGLRDELHSRFGELTIHADSSGTVLSHLVLDQAGLRALLSLLWDVGGELRLVTTADDETPPEHR